MSNLPRLLVTLGDVAGIGPEVIVRAWQQAELHRLVRLVVLGDVDVLSRTLSQLQLPGRVQEVHDVKDAVAAPDRIVCLQATEQNLGNVSMGQVNASAGQAAYDFLCRAIDLVKAKQGDGIVTAPLHKEGLRAAGLPYPGHTEILAERSGTARYAMMLYFEGERRKAKGEREGSRAGLGVTHVTLHMALKDVFQHLRPETILEKMELTDTMLTRLLCRRPRIGVCGLNPHAGDGGLFGNEEMTIIAPCIEAAKKKGIDVTGPWPSDTLFVRARGGEFDGLVAMYHDQGHIPFKLLAGWRAVNISLGLPFVRTSVAHGTAYDIAGKGVADPTSMIEAIRVAARLVRGQESGVRSQESELT